MMKFTFAAAAGENPGTVAVSPSDLYDPGKGYGFVTEKNFEDQDLLRYAEINSGFEPAPWYRGSDLTCIGQNELGCYIVQERDEQELRQIPLRFKCSLPAPGSYRVKVEICPKENMKDIRVFAGRRLLHEYAASCRAGEKLTYELAVNVCDIIPRGQEEAFDDRTLDLTVTADHPCISGIEVWPFECPVLYIAGDSTVTDQPAQYPYAPEDSYAGWGQMMPCFLKNGIAVSNHSHSGLTTESFRQEGHYQIVEKYAKAGDYLFVQFGHNDQKLDRLKAEEGYRDNLALYVKECRERGIHPLIVTPVARNSWKGSDGSYNDLLAEYAQACLKLGSELNVPVLDLHGLSMEFVTGKGKEAAKAYFFPSDFTHHNDFGALKMAEFVCRQIERTCAAHEDEAYRRLAGFLKKRAQEWGEPRQIEPLEKPEGYVVLSAAETLFEQLERPEEMLLRAEAMDMVIRSAGFFQTNVYNDFFDDVVGHEWYAGTVECALQNGILIPETCDGKLCRPKEEITLEHFLVFAINGYLSRKAAVPEEACPYDSSCKAWARSYVRMACSLGVLAKDGSDRLEDTLTRRRGAEILKGLRIL